MSRDVCFKNAEQRGLGQRKYYVLGWDGVSDAPVCSVKGHLGIIQNKTFSDLITKTLFYNAYKLPWDMQKTCFGYMQAVDQLENLTLLKDFLEAFDEDKNGIVTYEELGKKGALSYVAHMAGQRVSLLAQGQFGYLKSSFSNVVLRKFSNSQMNSYGIDICKDMMTGGTIMAAFAISQADAEIADPFQQGLTCGKGKWPSYKFAQFFQMASSLYGPEYPNKVVFPSLYGIAFAYADLTQNNASYIGEIRSEPNPNAIDSYVSTASKDKDKQLDFTFYVPEGYDTFAGVKLPNVEATSDPTKILTASFNGGKEIWA